MKIINQLFNRQLPCHLHCTPLIVLIFTRQLYHTPHIRLHLHPRSAKQTAQSRKQESLFEKQESRTHSVLFSGIAAYHNFLYFSNDIFYSSLLLN